MVFANLNSIKMKILGLFYGDQKCKKDVKKEVERVKFESNAKLNIRQLVNAIILAFIKEHSDELKNIRSG
jgi:hypothetical protein